MSLKIDPKDQKLMMGAAAVFVLLISGATILGGAGGPKAEIPSSYSTASGGAKAAYLVLADAGCKMQRWERPLNDLPPGAGRTLILADPAAAPTREERARLRAFLSEGGRLIATGMFAGTFLPENESIPDVLGAGTWKKLHALSPSRITRAAPEILLAPESWWQPYSTAYPLYGDASRSLVVQYPVGRGEVLWWASATPLTNAGLTESGNLEFLLASIGDSKGPILWDEYVHGYRETLASSIAHSPVKWLTLQLLFLGLAVVATFSRRSGPVCKPVTDIRLSPIEFVQTLGGLYERAGSASVAVDISYQRFRYWLTRRLGAGSNTSIEDLGNAVRDRFSVNDDHFLAILNRCESARTDPYLQGPEALHLVQELDEYARRLKLFQSTRKEKAR